MKYWIPTDVGEYLQHCNFLVLQQTYRILPWVWLFGKIQHRGSDVNEKGSLDERWTDITYLSRQLIGVIVWPICSSTQVIMHVWWETVGLVRRFEIWRVVHHINLLKWWVTWYVEVCIMYAERIRYLTYLCGTSICKQFHDDHCLASQHCLT